MDGYYKVILRYRRVTATLLATGLALNKGLPQVFPLTLSMPNSAALDADQFPYDHIVWLMRNTKRDLEIKDNIFAFVSLGSHCHGAGFSAFAKWKEPCVLGLPKTFFCSNVFEVEDIGIKIGNVEERVTCEGGPNEKAFLKSLIFSENAQKFAVAKQMIEFKDNWEIWKTLISPLFVALGYVACFHGTKLLFVFKKAVPFFQILQFQLASIIVTWFLCKIAKEALQRKIINSTDHKAASISEEYAIGAVEYCQNLQNTNKALRTLLGKQGENMFTVYGNVKEGLLLNKAGPSLSEREKRFNVILKSFQSNKS